ncbi:MAG: AbgT family transporter [Bacilli bacterium]|nr:AbgT family transporter [Bacilli bacterium]
MPEKRKLKLKKFYFHPITVFLFGILIIMILSLILSSFEMQTTYSTANSTGTDLVSRLVVVENLFSYDNLKYLISNTVKNFMGFSPLCMLLVSLIGISIANATGLIEVVATKYIRKMSKNQLTFLILFLGIISSIVNEVGYAILIPLAAILYEKEGRNPLLGIVTAFCGVAFGYGVTVFVGSQEVALIPYTTTAARLIDSTAHISLTSNLFFIIAITIILPFIGTPIIEKLVSPRLPKYRRYDKVTGKTLQTSELLLSDIEEEEQKKIAYEKNSKRGLKYATVTAILVILLFAYMIIPDLPGSGLLLDMDEKIYLTQLFGDNSYFQDGFSFMVAILFILTGLAYGIGARSIKNDKELIEKTRDTFHDISMVILLIFIFSQFLAFWKQSNISIVILGWIANLLSNLQLDGIILIVITTLLVGLAGLFNTSMTTKWMILSPVIVPTFMQNNISAPYAQIVMRVGHSMTCGITPLMAFFAIYLGYLNIYNQNKERPITIRQSLKFLMPYFSIMLVVWILIIGLWYITGFGIGPHVRPTI